MDDDASPVDLQGVAESFGFSAEGVGYIFAVIWTAVATAFFGLLTKKSAGAIVGGFLGMVGAVTFGWVGAWVPVIGAMIGAGGLVYLRGR